MAASSFHPLAPFDHVSCCPFRLRRRGHGVPQVSRRLYRRVCAALRSGSSQGDVKSAVYTYCMLLYRSLDPTAKYTFSYFSPELIGRRVAVIPLLLGGDATGSAGSGGASTSPSSLQQHPYMQALGAELLAAYTRAQSHADHKVSEIEALVPRVCALAAAPPPDGPAAQAASSIAPQHLAQRRTSALHALQEYLTLCHRLAVLPQHMATILSAVLSGVDLLELPGTIRDVPWSYRDAIRPRFIHMDDTWPMT